ncbi:DUF1186 domain-containing protein [uncultured Chryseobacterium sp.]|uniref:tetratricopeptide repeat protein n=1 Tax=uncultured Chryseobacterium sp. TaxID=259322 RepID=UPI0025E32B5B|nr:DUF1186 domain-containing protein [uncultured Chryseobacterium sp.]
MASKYSIDKIKIDYDTDTKNYPPFVLQKIEEFFQKVRKSKIAWKVAEDLQKLIVKFPRIPEFKNFLAVAFERLDRKNDLKNILLKTVEEHPDYIIGKVSLARFYMDNDEIDLAESVFGYAENVSDLLPGQQIFHYTQVQTFYYIRALIELKKNNEQNVVEILQLLHSMDAEKGYIDDLENRLMMHSLPDFRDYDLEPLPEKIIEMDSSEVEPALQNKELYKLYKGNLAFTDEVRSLDRNSVINDLRKLLKDAENRYHHFLSLGTDFPFPIHVLLLLRELKAEEALEDILDFISNDEDFLEFWLDDFLSEYLWEVIFVLSENKRETLKDFLLKPGIYSFSKGAVLSAMVQASFKEADIPDMWNYCLSVYINAKEEDNIISKEFFSLFVADVFPFVQKDFVENIKILFDKGWIDETLTGDFEELKSINLMPKQKKLTEISEICKIYS